MSEDRIVLLHTKIVEGIEKEIEKYFKELELLDIELKKKTIDYIKSKTLYERDADEYRSLYIAATFDRDEVETTIAAMKLQIQYAQKRLLQERKQLNKRISIVEGRNSLYS